ncbi:MAG: hypothetical protein PHT02_11545 [Tissierellia bacterium]|nr:hypothetical protein [Tissierellia bacterium]
MRYTTYELKIEYKYNKDVYRIIRTDGSNTLDDLSNEILSAFDFDNDHLYMFSLKRKRYDSDGYYHPEASGGKNADEISLNELNLKVRNKFLFVYDFGDEWLFDITVKKIEQSDILSLTFVKEQNGKLFQYPDWEDDYEEFSEDSVLENKYDFIDSGKSMAELLAKNKPSELKSIMRELGIKIPKVLKRASFTYATEIVKFLFSNKEKLLDLLTPSAAYHILYIADDNNNTITPELMEILSLEVLINMGLLEISDEYESFKIEIADELYEFADFFRVPELMEMINISYEWQKIISVLMNLYGVVDLEFLHKSLCNYLKNEIQYETLEKRVFMPMVAWGGMNVFNNEYVSIATLFSKEQTELILTNRNNFDIYDYKKFKDEELSAIISDGIISLMPSLEDLTGYFIFEKEISPNAATLLISELSLNCLLGVNQEIILEMYKEVLDDYSLKLTKKLKNIIIKVIQEHPCSLLMGYSWNEYNNRDKLIDNQINLFDNDSYK